MAKMQLMGIEISKSIYAKLETNRMNIKTSELIALQKIFKVDFNAFFEGPELTNILPKIPGAPQRR